MISFPVTLLRLTVALLLGAIIGFEREQKEHAAGMRTLALVSLGCALFTIVSAYGFLDLLTIPHTVIDPTRIASYIVAGIGFLGGGIIFVSRQNERVKGLTTAATVWVIAAVGIACGIGMILEALATTVMMLFILFLLPFVERTILPRASSSTHHLSIEASSSISGQFITTIYDICMRNKVTIEKLHLQAEKESEVLGIICRISSEESLAKVISEMRALPEVSAIQANLHSTSDGNAILESPIT
jgi:putative Mg2+ transporter-C (MgtC) family protein